MLLSVANVSKSFGLDVILKGVTFRLDAREKVALVGRNGAGKTTLLKILTGQLDPDSGSVHLAKGAKIGYLRQEAPVTFGRSVIEEAQAAREDQLEMQARLSELEGKLETASPEELEEYSLLHEHFLDNEGYSVERDVATVLKRMGFTEDEFSRPTTQLSGGEKTRLAIARLLLEEPDLLILDEPTNHLDLQASEWLEGWIKGYRGAVLLVSHDRTFLEATADRVLDLREETVRPYPGPFEHFLKVREEEDLRQAEVSRRQEGEMAKLDEYVRRFMNSQRTAQARGRQKMLERMKADHVEGPQNQKIMAGGFREVKRSGDLVVEVKALEVGYPGSKLFGPFDWTVRIGERWGIIGENGIGKSTLVKVLLREVEELGGKHRIGSNVVPGVFTQDASNLDQKLSPLDLMVYEENLPPQEARDLLGRFLITGDDVYRPIGTLSGGEKNKLSLARLTRLNPNLLILDEPTNHLDMASRSALANVLKDYKGTLILVSHDRHLLSEVTDQTLDIRKGSVTAFPGSYAEYRRRQRAGTADRASVKQTTEVKPKTEPTMTPRELSKEIQRIDREISDCETLISNLEAEQAALETRLASLKEGDDVLALSTKHGEVHGQIQSAMKNWEDLHERIEELRSMQGQSI